MRMRRVFRQALILGQEIDRQDEKRKADEMVEAQGLALEEEDREDGEHRERDDLLNDFELDEAEGAAIANVANAIGWDLAAIFKKSHTPTDEYDGEQRQVSAPLCGAQAQMTIPSYGHKAV